MQKNNEKEMNKFIDKVFLPKITNAGRWPYRLRGGAGIQFDQNSNIERSLLNLEESTRPMVEKAIKSAKKHGIAVHRGPNNLANGDCVFETVLDSINTKLFF